MMRNLCHLLSIVIATLACSALNAQMPDTDIWLLKLEKGALVSAQQVTQRRGYDNQPRFTQSGRSIYYVSIYEDQQADVYEYKLKDSSVRQVTSSRESEYSPTPKGRHFFTVQVSLDSVQSLWKYARKTKGHSRSVFPAVNKVGYFCRKGRHTLAFILGEPNTLEYIRPSGLHRVISTDPGRCMLRVPGKCRQMYYVQKGDSAQIRSFHLRSGKTSKVADCLSGSEDFAILPDRSLIMGSRGILYKFTPKEGRWQEWIDLRPQGISDFYRVVVSRDGNSIAVVTFSGQKP